jgi:transposase-like protein
MRDAVMAINLSAPVFTDEEKARAYFEAIRWPDGPTCPHCGNVDASRIYEIAANPQHKVRAGLRECQDCHGQFTVRTGSVMESSHLPLTKWALAYRLMASAKKGISAHQMHRTLGITYKTAWFLCHRIREAMRDTSGDKLGGSGVIVEADETYVGGKPRKGTKAKETRADRKTPVAILVERGGRARAMVVSHPLSGILKRNIVASVEPGTEIHTDEHKGYRNVDKLTGGFHFSVNHWTGEFAKEDIHVNTAESWNALLKRSIIGSFHHVSREHLSRYCDEVSFRWDRRSIDDTERTAAAVKNGEGKRLTYRRSRSTQSPSA